MRNIILAALLFTVTSGYQTRAAEENSANTKQPAKDGVPGNALYMRAEPFGPMGDLQPVTVKPMSETQLNDLLNTRIKGGLPFTFRQFANMFVVGSMLSTGKMIGLVSSSDNICDSELTNVFPDTYKPTVREFLDVIAIQTGSQWKYEPTNKFIKSDKKTDKPIEEIGIFEFQESERTPPYTIKLAEGWKSSDRGGWVANYPPIYPVGMDIFELGHYSANDASKDDLTKKIPFDVALEWAKRVKPDATVKDITTTKVADYEASYFDTILKAKTGENMRWRHWAFMADQHGYLILSTILPENENKLFPDVQSMMNSFKIVIPKH